MQVVLFGPRPITPSPEGRGVFTEEDFPLIAVRTTLIGGVSEGVQGKRTAQWAVAEGEFPERSGGGRSESPLVAREGETSPRITT